MHICRAQSTKTSEWISIKVAAETRLISKISSCLRSLSGSSLGGLWTLETVNYTCNVYFIKVLKRAALLRQTFPGGVSIDVEKELPFFAIRLDGSVNLQRWGGVP